MATKDGGGANQRRKSQEAAAALRARGILHGMRETTTNAPPVPNPKDVGSAAYRRLRKQ
jgi:hypothetical protein